MWHAFSATYVSVRMAAAV